MELCDLFKELISTGRKCSLLVSDVKVIGAFGDTLLCVLPLNRCQSVPSFALFAHGLFHKHKYLTFSYCTSAIYSSPCQPEYQRELTGSSHPVLHVFLCLCLSKMILSSVAFGRNGKDLLQQAQKDQSHTHTYNTHVVITVVHLSTAPH